MSLSRMHSGITSHQASVTYVIDLASDVQHREVTLGIKYFLLIVWPYYFFLND